MTASTAPIAGAFATILEAERDVLNARFAHARRRFPALDGEDFARHLTDCVAPIIEAAPDTQKDFVARALYDISLEMLGRQLIGSRAHHAVIARAWTQWFLRAPRLLIAEPKRFVAATCNALMQLCETAGAHAEQWLEAMIELESRCADIEIFLQIGGVVAWRCGLAHARESALEAAAQLPPALVLRALEIENENADETSAQNGHPTLSARDRQSTLRAGDTQSTLSPDSASNIAPDAATQSTLCAGDIQSTLCAALLEKLRADAWLHPRAAWREVNAEKTAPRTLKIVARAGAFRGLGGEFLAPPRVWSDGENLFVADHRNGWILHADVFGATLRPVAGDVSQRTSSSDAASADFRINAEGDVSRGALSTTFPELRGATSVAATQSTLCVTTALSHAVFIVAAVADGE